MTMCVLVCESLSPSHNRWPHTPLSLRWVSLDPARPKSRCPCSVSPSALRSLQKQRKSRRKRQQSINKGQVAKKKSQVAEEQEGCRGEGKIRKINCMWLVCGVCECVWHSEDGKSTYGVKIHTLFPLNTFSSLTYMSIHYYSSHMHSYKIQSYNMALNIRILTEIFWRIFNFLTIYDIIRHYGFLQNSPCVISWCWKTMNSHYFRLQERECVHTCSWTPPFRPSPVCDVVTLTTAVPLGVGLKSETPFWLSMVKL